MKNKSNIWFQNNRNLKVRDLNNPRVLEVYKKKQNIAYRVAERVVEKAQISFPAWSLPIAIL